MKTIGVAEAKDDFSGFLEEAQSEQVVIMRHGKPFAIVTGAAGRSIEEIIAADLERRRAEPRVSHKQVIRELKADEMAERGKGPARGWRKNPTRKTSRK